MDPTFVSNLDAGAGGGGDDDDAPEGEALARVRAALRAVGARFREYVEQSPLSTQILTPDGVTVSVNPAFERLFGMTIADVRDYNMLRDPELARLGVMPLIERGFAGETVRVPPIPYVPDRGDYAGRVRWAGALFYPVRGEGGQLEYVVLIHEDVTERKAAEDKLRASEAEFRAFFDLAGTGNVQVDPATLRFVRVNRRFCEMTGYAGDELIARGMTIRDVMHPDERPRVMDVVDAMVRGERSANTIERRLLRKDGGTVWVQSTATAVRDAAGNIVKFAAVMQDVDERKRAAEAVRESEERLRTGLDAGNAGTWEWDIATGRVTWSERLYDIHGIAPGAFGGTADAFAALVHEADRPRVRAAIERAIAERSAYESEFRVVRPGTGELRWISTRGRAYYDAAGRPVRMSGATTDVTARKEVEAERDRLLESERAARAEAERASRTKDEFLATLSHELRTPLNAIFGYAQLLRGGTSSPQELEQGLEVIERNARVQTQIIEDLLDMSRIVAGKLRLDVRTVRPADAVDGAVQTVAPAARAKGIEVDVAVGAGAGPVRADAARLQQVMWNLLNNAIKFTPRGGRVRVAVARVESRVEVAVSDTGVGISREFLPHVFDRFRQADASTTRRYGGLGLGLSIVKHLVELHGGTVVAQSPGEGQGATFVVALPVAAVDGGAEGEAGGAPAGRGARWGGQPSLAGVTVVAVDDDPDARELVRRLLEEAGAAVVTAGSAAEAIRFLEAGRADVLVSDIGMPGEDGYDLIKRVRGIGKDRGGDVPAVALTAFARSEDRTRALLAGYQFHLAKPVEPAELRAVVASLAGRAG